MHIIMKWEKKVLEPKKHVKTNRFSVVHTYQDFCLEWLTYQKNEILFFSRNFIF